jgi:hypothetical protein
MNKDIVTLKEKYKDKLYPNKKNYDEFLKLLHKKFNLKLVNEDAKYRNMIELTKRSCMYSSYNNGKFKYEELNIQTYEIIQDELSYKYYEKYDENNLSLPPIYIMIETNTGFLNSNYNDILIQLILYRGISKKDIENNTDDLLVYLLIIDKLEEND